MTAFSHLYATVKIKGLYVKSQLGFQINYNIHAYHGKIISKAADLLVFMYQHVRYCSKVWNHYEIAVKVVLN